VPSLKNPTMGLKVAREQSYLSASARSLSLRSFLMTEVINWLVALVTLTGAILNVYRKRYCFVLWMFTNIYWLIHNYLIMEYAQSALAIVFLSLSIFGWIKWKDSNG